MVCAWQLITPATRPTQIASTDFQSASPARLPCFLLSITNLQTRKLPLQCPTGIVMIQCSPNPGNPFERHPLPIYIEIHSQQSQSHLPSRSPRPSLSPTSHARRLPHSPPTPIFRKECRLDRLTGTGPPQYVAASIPYRVPLKLAAHGNTVVKSCPSRPSQSCGCELVSELNPKSPFGSQVLRSQSFRPPSMPTSPPVRAAAGR